jgi:3-methylcrotonyl-CoA carboxylase beta subunit
MAIIESALDPRSDEFRANRMAMESLVGDLRAKFAASSLGGGDTACARHLARGKLLPATGWKCCSIRTPFLELTLGRTWALSRRGTRRRADHRRGSCGRP